MRKRASSSRAARGSPSSMRGNRRKRGHDFAWYTCHPRCSSELIKNFGIGFSERAHASSCPKLQAKNSGSGTKSFEGMGQKDTNAHQAHYRANCLDHRKHPCHPAYGQNDCGAAQSKRFKWGNRRSEVTEDLTQHNVRKRDKAEPDCP